MNLLSIFISCAFVCCVSCRNNNVRALTESMGQEVIEIGHSIKGLDEEPSVEAEDYKDPASLQTLKKMDRRTSAPNPQDPQKKVRDVDRIDGVTPEDEESRIAKELAEIYKDTADYKESEEDIDKPIARTEKLEKTEKPEKAEKPEKTKKTNDSEEPDTSTTTKPIGRQRTLQKNFKFQPDSTESAELEKFRTSIDEIACMRQQKLSHTVRLEPREESTNAATAIIQVGIPLNLLLALCCH